MKQAAYAMMTCLRAPWRRAGYVLLIWGARLVPIVLVVGFGAYDAAYGASAHDPRSRYLLDGASMSSGYTQAWSKDFYRDQYDPGDSFFWMAVTGWLVVTLLSGGLYTRLATPDRTGSYWTECGRWFGRFVRLGLVALLFFYVADVGVNVFLEQRHFHEGMVHHTQDHRWHGSLLRGGVFLVVWHLVGVLHSYARIQLVIRGGKSAIVAWFRGMGALIARFPKLLVLELGLVSFQGLAILLAWFAIGNSGLLTPHSSSASIGIWLVLAMSVSYLRTGLEVGVVDARCSILAPDRDGAHEPSPPAEPAPESMTPVLKGTEDLPPLVPPPA